MSVHLIQCARCKGTVDDGSSFCPHCGEAIVYAAPNDDPFVGRMVSQHYKVIEIIARGGMGEVYSARHAELNQRVAVKFLHRRFADDEEFAGRFFNEARSACRVNHPNAVSIYDFGRLDDGTLYIVMEYVEGVSLKEMITRDGQLPVKTALRITQQAADVLSAAHRQSIIHRDVKPDNIMVLESPSGRVSIKMLDFGIAKILDDDSSFASMTQTGVTFGTPEYMSPEQAAGREVDERSDIYSLCVCLFTMLAGHPPFRGKNKLALLQRHIREPAPALDRAVSVPVPATLTQLVARGLQKDAERRPQTMDDLAAELERIEGLELNASHSQGRPVLASPRASERPRASSVEAEAAFEMGDLGSGDERGPTEFGLSKLGPADLSAADVAHVGPSELGTSGSRAPRGLEGAGRGRVLTHNTEPDFAFGSQPVGVADSTEAYELGAGAAQREEFSLGGTLVEESSGRYALGGGGARSEFSFADEDEDPFAAPLHRPRSAGRSPSHVVMVVGALVVILVGIAVLFRALGGGEPSEVADVEDPAVAAADPSLEAGAEPGAGSGAEASAGAGVEAGAEPALAANAENADGGVAAAAPPGSSAGAGTGGAAPSAGEGVAAASARGSEAAPSDGVREGVAAALAALREGDRARARAALRELELGGAGQHEAVQSASNRLRTVDNLVATIDRELGAGNCVRADEAVVDLQNNYSRALAIRYWGALDSCREAQRRASAGTGSASGSASTPRPAAPAAPAPREPAAAEPPSAGPPRSLDGDSGSPAPPTRQAEPAREPEPERQVERTPPSRPPLPASL